MKPAIRHFRDLEVYRRAFTAAMKIFELTKRFPAAFKNKITDSMQEASETQCWLEFSLACGYIDQAIFDELDDEYEQIIAMLNSMEMNADKFCF